MPEPHHRNALGAIDRASLTPVVRLVLADDTADVLDWDHHPLQQVTATAASGTSDEDVPITDPALARAVDDLLSSFATADRQSGPHRGVFRLTGHARTKSGAHPWTLILKIQKDPWQRELNAYRSGLLADMPPTFGMPACYRVDQHPDDEYWLWLEDVRDDIGDVWPVERFGLAARHLAHFNGPYLVDRELPDAPWLGRKPSLNWDATERAIAQLESIKAHPMTAIAYSPENAEGVRRLWKDRVMFRDALAGLPDTLCHLDAQRSNLMARAENGIDRTIAIDWGGVGIGVLGIEIAQLATNFRSVRDVEIDRLQELGDVIFESYLQGLRDVGWKGDPRLLRLGFVASAALQNGLLDIWSLRGSANPEGYPRMRLLWGERPVEELMHRRGALLRHILALADEARALIDRESRA